jgi:hemerythrin
MNLQDFTRWQPSYSVGNWVLDNQHKVIFGLCKEAIESVPDGSQGLAVQFRVIRNDLLGCVEEHFGTEETLLRHCRYPLLEKHQEEHLDFQIKLAKFLMSTAMGKVRQADLHRFLSHWWCEHILSSDKEFAGSIHRVR